MNRRRSLALTILPAAIVAGLACHAQTIVGLTASDEAALRQALDTEMKAANAADAAGWASVYAQDAIVLRPHASAVQGREQKRFPPNMAWSRRASRLCDHVAAARGSSLTLGGPVFDVWRNSGVAGREMLIAR